MSDYRAGIAFTAAEFDRWLAAHDANVVREHAQTVAATMREEFGAEIMRLQAALLMVHISWSRHVAGKIGLPPPTDNFVHWLRLHRSEAAACMGLVEYGLLSQEMGWDT